MALEGLEILALRANRASSAHSQILALEASNYAQVGSYSCAAFCWSKTAHCSCAEEREPGEARMWERVGMKVMLEVCRVPVWVPLGW